MIISIASGKGGTGKTTLATNLALSINKNIQFLDCDVEEPDSHIFLKPKIKKIKNATIPIPEIDKTRCDFCGKCADICAYNALAVLKDKVLIFPNLCHGCGGCSILCPQKAIKEVKRDIGIIEIGNSSKIEFIHGKLNIGEVMAPPLIRIVKDHINIEKLVIIDAPPGTTCPVIEAIKGSDFCILVTEPTPFGLNDLIMAVEVLRKLNISFGVVINRSNIGDDRVDNYCREEDIPVLMRIPYSKDIAISYSEGIPMVERFPEYKNWFLNLYEWVVDRIK
jgi:MinD superfamily P-loop ATPase